MLPLLLLACRSSVPLPGDSGAGADLDHPLGYALSDVRAQGVELDSLQWSVDGDVAVVELQPAAAGDLELSLVF